MKKMKIILISIFVIAIALVILQNTARVQAHFLWFTAEVSVIVLLFFTALGGFLLGLLVMLLKRGNGKSKTRKLSNPEYKVESMD
jgi:uncharacterized integral membrane protein